jgi:hypothetical protein
MEKPSIRSVLPEIVTVHTIVRRQLVEKNRLFVKVFEAALYNTHFSKIVEQGTESPVHKIAIHGFLRNPIHHGIEANPLVSLVFHEDVQDELLSKVLCEQAFPRFHRDLDITGTVLNSNRIPLFGSNPDEILLTRFLNGKIQRCNVGRNFYAGIIGLNASEPTYRLDVCSSLRCR